MDTKDIPKTTIQAAVKIRREQMMLLDEKIVELEMKNLTPRWMYDRIFELGVMVGIEEKKAGRV